MIKNIILDMGNVLLNFDPQIPLDAFCNSEEEKASIRRELFDGPEWLLGDMGLIHDEDRYTPVKKRLPLEYWPALKKCCDHWDICMKPLPGAENFCRYLKNRGYGVYVLSNASDAFYRYFPKFLPLCFFDGVVVSADIHCVKPDPDIYHFLLNTYNLVPSECLFIDDRMNNVQGAVAVGMNACQFLGDFDKVLQLFSL